MHPVTLPFHFQVKTHHALGSTSSGLTDDDFLALDGVGNKILTKDAELIFHSLRSVLRRNELGRSKVFKYIHT